MLTSPAFLPQRCSAAPAEETVLTTPAAATEAEDTEAPLPRATMTAARTAVDVVEEIVTAEVSVTVEEEDTGVARVEEEGMPFP